MNAAGYMYSIFSKKCKHNRSVKEIIYFNLNLLGKIKQKQNKQRNYNNAHM